MRIEIARAHPTDRSVAVIPLIDRDIALPASLDPAVRRCCEADIAAVGFSAEPGEILDVSPPAGSPLSRILLVGIGAGADRAAAPWSGWAARSRARLLGYAQAR
jgi:hypothetical protein